MVDWDSLEFFSKKEFDCRCGCGQNEMQADFLEKLDDLRRRLGFPLIVSSGYRCPEHNNRVSNTGYTGPHTTGRAVDFVIRGGDAKRLVTQASLGGWMNGIGVNQKGPHHKRFIHLDDLTAEGGRHRPTIWSY